VSTTLSKKNWLEPVRESGGVIERRRGGVTSSYWNNYWTAPSQPEPPVWHLQQCTVAVLLKERQLIVTARRRGMPSRCAMPSVVKA